MIWPEYGVMLRFGVIGQGPCDYSRDQGEISGLFVIIAGIKVDFVWLSKFVNSLHYHKERRWILLISLFQDRVAK